LQSCDTATDLSEIFKIFAFIYLTYFVIFIVVVLLPNSGTVFQMVDGRSCVAAELCGTNHVWRRVDETHEDGGIDGGGRTRPCSAGVLIQS
jgi:hypothetical protein